MTLCTPASRNTVNSSPLLEVSLRTWMVVEDACLIQNRVGTSLRCHSAVSCVSTKSLSEYDGMMETNLALRRRDPADSEAAGGFEKGRICVLVHGAISQICLVGLLR